MRVLRELFQSNKYCKVDLEHLVAPVSEVWDCGEEYVRFIDTVWVNAVLPDPEVTASVRVQRIKVLRVQGQSTGEIYFLTKRVLQDALEGKPRYASRFINRKRDHEIMVQWTFGLTVDPDSGIRREGFQITPAVDCSTGAIMRKIQGPSRVHDDTEALPAYEKGTYDESLTDDEFGDVKLFVD